MGLGPSFRPLLAGATSQERIIACLGAALCLALTVVVCPLAPLPLRRLPVIVAPLGALASRRVRQSA
jgi:CBS domain-containing membrane protein